MRLVHHFVDFVEGEGKADEDGWQTEDGQEGRALHVLVHDSLLKLAHAVLDRIQLQSTETKKSQQTCLATQTITYN